MKQDPSDWREALRARLATWRQTRPRRLTLLAQGALVFERFARAIAPALIVTGFFVALSWTGLWLGAPSWLRILGVSAFIGALVAALTRLRTFSLAQRRSGPRCAGRRRFRRARRRAGGCARQ